MRTVRNLGFVALLWALSAPAVPARASALNDCAPPNYEDQQNWVGQCAPGGQDACGYFRWVCDNYCWSNYAGYCSDSLDFCSEVNEGDPPDSSPNWCLTEGYCDCFYDYQ